MQFILLNYSGTFTSGFCKQLCSVTKDICQWLLQSICLFWHICMWLLQSISLICQWLLWFILLNCSSTFASAFCNQPYSITMAHFPVVVAINFPHSIWHICQQLLQLIFLIWFGTLASDCCNWLFAQYRGTFAWFYLDSRCSSTYCWLTAKQGIQHICLICVQISLLVSVTMVNLLNVWKWNKDNLHQQKPSQWQKGERLNIKPG